MTTIFPQVINCIICNAENEVFNLGSTNSFGHTDLDYRPTGMARYTLIYEVQTCINCGFSSPIISSDFKELLPENKEEQKEQLIKIKKIIASKEYKELLSNESFPDFSNLFLAASLIQEKIGNYNHAFNMSIKSAWIADDNSNINAAKYSREKAFELIDKTTDDFIDNKTRLLLKIELLRRTEQFEEANEIIEAALEELKSDDHTMQIIKFQSVLIHKKDKAVHRHDEVAVT